MPLPYRLLSRKSVVRALHLEAVVIERGETSKAPSENLDAKSVDRRKGSPLPHPTGKSVERHELLAGPGSPRPTE